MTQMDKNTFCALLQQKNAPELCIDSRAVQAGDAFVALPSCVPNGVSGCEFIEAAIAKGAAYIVCPDTLNLAPFADKAVQFCALPNPRAALGELAACRYGTSALPFALIGITGTNGKTTSTYLLEHLFSRAGFSCGVIGTISTRWQGYTHTASMTTPDSVSLHKMFAQMRDAGTTHAFMEVSSHALDQHRVAALPFTGALLTNVTQDHLDYHTSIKNYFAAKSRLFTELPNNDKTCVINADDAWGQKLLAQLPDAIGFSLHGVTAGKNRMIYGQILENGTDGLHLAMNFAGQKWDLRSPLVGAFNAANLVGAQMMALSHGLSVDNLQTLRDFMGVSGRMERIPNAQGLDIFVDYAHTPDALMNVLTTLRTAGFKRIISVFGCGGNRDRTKRPLMGAVVQKYADAAVLTSDNPRHENPQAIMDEVRQGLGGSEGCLKECAESVDRKCAIEKALSMMQKGDALLVAGKGHEDYQIIGDTKIHFSDQEIIRAALNA